ncbi:UbiA prenyltransferase family-domain-containing protein [Annulohypoxylon truncatum]|uniref:UbiA prenyltransferase family-domain-containing protein n=1 Tax=Annulohypoxylon truncatum TaxID=327061 RepID=UPI0020079633|nr:UbiA prenyltransferase family-domain-containing protein [Annulohypoxylon truncatum]KAI1208142.1 UbiA prenyltransferase family-domain-containing protein [Annulohypoxylon truncatum]
MSDTQGNQRRWYDCLPSSWVPYMEMCHISTPAPIFLIYFPHIYGAICAAAIEYQPLSKTLYTCAVLLGGTVFFSNAAHAWNDIIDAPIDRLIPRTANRPIPRGAIRPRDAFTFAGINAVGAAAFLLLLPRETALCTVPTIVGTLYYPWAKRHTYFAQVVLGYCLSWGCMVGASAMDMSKPWTDNSVLCIFLACILWTVIYDTIYSHMDLQEDIRVGVKSMAVLLQNGTKAVLWILLGCMLVLLVVAGVSSDMSIQYVAIAVGGCLTSQALMIYMVDLTVPESCWWWFANGFWITGTSVAFSLLYEYLLRLSQG